MIFERIKTPGMAHVAYLTGNQGEAAVVDPRRDADEYMTLARKHELTIKYSIETHRQEVFAMGSAELVHLCAARVIHGRHEAFGHDDTRLDDGENFEIARGIRIVALHTPGRTTESMCYAAYLDDAPDHARAVCTGDTLFIGETGRTDLGDPDRTAERAARLYDAVHAQPPPLGDQAIVLPAHGSGSVCGGDIAERDDGTIGLERRYNPVFERSREQFVQGKLDERLPRPPYLRHMERVNSKGGMGPLRAAAAVRCRPWGPRRACRAAAARTPSSCATTSASRSPSPSAPWSPARRGRARGARRRGGAAACERGAAWCLAGDGRWPVGAGSSATHASRGVPARGACTPAGVDPGQSGGHGTHARRPCVQQWIRPVVAWLRCAAGSLPAMTYDASALATLEAAPPDDGGGTRLRCAGAWTVHRIAVLQRELDAVAWPARGDVVVDASAISILDTAGAWVLHRTTVGLERQGRTVRVEGLRPEFASLLKLIASKELPLETTEAAGEPWLARVGRRSWSALEGGTGYLAFVGESFLALLRVVRQPHRIRWRAILHNVQTAGVEALPITGLLSFLLGIVIAYQGADQLQRFGANIFVADLVGISMLRELSPMMTAIIIAGRSGSAYTAQIGTMKVTEEIDALRTIGVPPLELLVLPKMIALVIVMPLLTVYTDVTGVLGGMVMAQWKLGVDFRAFLDRLDDAIVLSTYWTGLLKAPVFAMIVALVGCYRGFQVTGSAESVGTQTTMSVVQAIFLVIVTDAMFSIVFLWLDL